MDGRQATRAWVGAMVVVALALRVRGAPLLYRRAVPTDLSFGPPGSGIHAHHVLGVATADFLGSAALAVALAALSGGSVTAWLVVTLVSGELLHAAYGVPTATSRWLFGQTIVPA